MSEEIAPPMSDNEALRRILAEVELMEDFLLKDYDDITGQNDQQVTDGDPYERAAMGNAVCTVITNLEGSDPINVLEDDKIVRILLERETWVSPNRGKKKINVTVLTDRLATFSIATYIRNS